MQEIRNSMNRLICCIDIEIRLVEIVIKGCKTTIQFLNNGKVLVKHAFCVA